MRILEIVFFVAIAVMIEVSLEVFLVLDRNNLKEELETNKWISPNAICVWRTILSFISMFFVFQLGWFLLGVTLFTFASLLDRLDGIIARDFNLMTEIGKWLDPFADKLDYLPYIVIFAYLSFFSINLVWILVSVEASGQLGRRLVSRLGGSIAANKIGKAKAVVLYSTVAHGLLLYDGLSIPNIGDYMLILGIALSALSFITKVMPLSWYEKYGSAVRSVFY